jgi:hypothetical protein
MISKSFTEESVRLYLFQEEGYIEFTQRVPLGFAGQILGVEHRRKIKIKITTQTLTLSRGLSF